MKFLTSASISGSFGNSTMLANHLYAIPIELSNGIHTIDQALMQFQFSKIRVALYTDNNGYPNELLADFGGSPTISDKNSLYSISSILLSGGRYWIVCIADREANVVSYLSDFKPMLIPSLGLDVTKSSSIVGYVIRSNYETSFSLIFPTDAITLTGDNSIPLIALREIDFVPESGSSGYSGFSGYSGQNGIIGLDGESGYSGYSGLSGQDGTIGEAGESGFSGYSGYSGVSGYSGYSGISGATGPTLGLPSTLAIDNTTNEILIKSNNSNSNIRIFNTNASIFYTSGGATSIFNGTSTTAAVGFSNASVDNYSIYNANQSMLYYENFGSLIVGYLDLDENQAKLSHTTRIITDSPEFQWSSDSGLLSEAWIFGDVTGSYLGYDGNYVSVDSTLISLIAANSEFSGIVTIDGLAGSGTRLVFADSSGVLSALATANTSVLTTDGSGASSWTAQGTAFNKNFGTGSGTVTEGNDSRLLPNGLGDVHYTLYTFSAVLSPADATTYYFNQRIAPSTTAANHGTTSGEAFVVYGATIVCALASVPGTSEANTLYLRNITAGTSHLIGTFSSNGSSIAIQATTFTGLNISVDATDEWCYEFLTPTFAVNPVGVTYNVTLRCKRQ